MTQTKQFAPSIDFNDDGLLTFPNDVSLRRRFFPIKVDHPAHNNMHMLHDIVQYTTEPGDWICDPMAGAGSMMYTVSSEANLDQEFYRGSDLGAPRRKLVLIELGPYFSTLLLDNNRMLERDSKLFTDSVLVFPESDCTYTLKIMPNRFQLICFSPPYSDQLQVRSGHAIYDQREGQEGTAGIANFTYDHPQNLGNMDEFRFNLAMRDVYKACYNAALPGGYMVLIIKDRIKAGKRVWYSTHHMGLARDAGWSVSEVFQREAIGMLFGHYNLQHGIKQITDEHIIFMRKEI